MTKGKKNRHPFWLMDMSLKLTRYINFMDVLWHRHTCLKIRTKRQQKRYRDTCQIDWLIENNGWDTKYNLASACKCEEPTLKKVRFEKKLTPYPHFIVYDFETISAPLNEHPTDDLTHLSSRIPISVAVHVTLSKEAVHLVDEKPKSLIEQFIKVLTEK